MNVLWSVILVAVGIVLGTVMTCVAPSVAVAVLAARTLSLRRAFAVVAAMWLGNQAVGYGFEHVPHDGATFAWGLVILGATCAAVLVARRIRVTAVAFVAAFVVFEVLQFTYALAISDAANFTPAIDALVFEGNLLGIAVLGAIRLAMTARSRGSDAARIG